MASASAYLTRLLSPFAFLRVGETSGTAAADTMGNHAGTYTGTYTLNATGALAGDADPSLSLAGAGGVNLGDHTDFSFGSGDFTISLWANRSNGTRAQLVARDDETDGREFALGINAGGAGSVELLLFESGTADYAIYSTGVGLVPQDEWVHIAAGRSGSSAFIYVNGCSRSLTNTGTKNLPFTLPSTGCDLTIGFRTYSGAEDYLVGYLDEISLFNTALTRSQIRRICGAGMVDLGAPGNVRFGM